MEGNGKQPRTIFEQIVLGQEVINENIVTLAENLNVLMAKVDILLAIFTTPPVKKQPEPDASGADNSDQ